MIVTVYITETKCLTLIWCLQRRKRRCKAGEESVKILISLTTVMTLLLIWSIKWRWQLRYALHFILLAGMTGWKSYILLLNPYPAGTKMISLCYQCRARPVCTSVQSDEALYCWITNFQVFILISLNMIQKGKKICQTFGLTS